MNNELDDACSTLAARTPWKPLADPGGAEAAPAFDAVTSQSLPSSDMHVLRDVSRAMAHDAPPATRVATLLESALRGAAATWGVIAVLRDGGWEAVAEATAANAAHPERRPVDRLPVPIIAAAVHLRNGMVLRDACAVDHWRTDDYVRRRKPRAVICMPIRCDGELTGALYLEHRDVPGLFTPAKAALVEVVALHAGCVLENLRLRDELRAQRARLCSVEAAMRETRSEMDRNSRLTAYGELAASIVHEVAQPITAIDTSARAGLKWLDRTAPNLEAAREMLAHICACTVRARTIIGALRARARRAAPEFAVFDLADALREAAEILESTLDAMKVKLRVDGCASAIPVRGERVQLQQAIISLLMNGAESMMGTREDARVIVLTCESDTSLLRIRIDDNGDGFDPQLAARLFEPLFTTKPHGMGMGLSICKSIVEAHHGQLDLAPRGDGGTRATVTLPVASI